MSSWLTKHWSGDAEPPSESDDAPGPGESAAAAVHCPGYSVEAGFDYTGGDIGLDPKTVSDAAACAACETTHLCNAYTFVVRPAPAGSSLDAGACGGAAE